MRASVVMLVLAGLALSACTEATASRVGERTFKIEGPQMGIMSDAPNRRLASRVCPKGYRVLDSASHKGGPDRATDDFDTMTVWTIRCI
ncbi:MAG TPA: hypothetical protein VJR70_05915 [Stellaceae bacterium]|nr:hypothetical protein [Stellaceae bacterium]